MRKTLLTFIVLWVSLNVNGQAARNVLFEEFSTAPCGFCPDGDVIAEGMAEKYPNMIWVTHHAGFGKDAMTIPEGVAIAKDVTNFAPAGLFDRVKFDHPLYSKPERLVASRQIWDSLMQVRLSEGADAGIAISNNYDTANRTLDCTVDVTFYGGSHSGDIRLNLFIVEDSVVGTGYPDYDQKNYLNGYSGHRYYQAGDTIRGYVHHHVVRQIPTGAWGLTGVIPTTPVIGTKYSKNFSISIPSEWLQERIDIVAFASYYNSDFKSRNVINANHLKMTDVKTISASVSSNRILKNELLIYPNPARESVFISASKFANNQKIQISDLTGRVEYSATVFKNEGLEISLNGISNGIYIVRLISDKGQVLSNQKLVVNH